jgi:hypothetical protein
MPHLEPLKKAAQQPTVKRLGSRPGSAVPGNARTKKLPTGGRPAHSRRGR